MKSNKFTMIITEERRKRKISQDVACQMIGISDTSTISKWENGVVIPSDDMVLRLMEAYGEPIIGYVYLQTYTKVGQKLLPDILLSDLDNLVLNFQAEFESMKKMKNEIIEIARDGVVDENKQTIWSQIQNKSYGLCSILFPLMIRNFDKGKSSCKAGTLQELI